MSRKKIDHRIALAQAKAYQDGFTAGKSSAHTARRDYFAATALNGLLACPSCWTEDKGKTGKSITTKRGIVDLAFEIAEIAAAKP